MGDVLRTRASRAAHGAAKRLRRPATIAIAYSALAVFSFGHSAARQYAAEETAYEWCLNNTPHLYCDDPDTLLMAYSASFAGALWPLYWSWEAQQ